jgi:arginine transport system substrate-binding protein
MKFNRTLIIFVCVIVATLSYIVIKQVTKKPSNVKTSDELIVGTASGYAPYVSLNAQGEYEGFDIDIAKELSKRMNKKLILKDLGSMVPLLLSLKQGSVDLLIWALEINKSRLKEMAMIQYQGGNTTTYPLVFWGSIPNNIKSLEDLKSIENATICVEPGSSQERFLNKLDFIAKKPLEKVVDMILDIKYGKSLAAMIDPSLIKNVVAKNPELKILEIPLDEDSMSFGNGICIKKENSQLIEQVKSIIDAMKIDGTIARLEQKWNLGK